MKWSNGLRIIEWRRERNLKKGQAKNVTLYSEKYTNVVFSHTPFSKYVAMVRLQLEDER